MTKIKELLCDFLIQSILPQLDTYTEPTNKLLLADEIDELAPSLNETAGEQERIAIALKRCRKEIETMTDKEVIEALCLTMAIDCIQMEIVRILEEVRASKNAV